MREKILLCGPRSASAITGVALAFDLLIEGAEVRGIPLRVVDATRGVTVSKSGTFSMRRSFDTLCVVVLVWWHLLRCQIYYATMSTSNVGFIRDYLTVGFAKLLGRRTVQHLHGGGFEDFYINGKPWLQRMIRANLRRTDTIVVLGKLLKEQFECVGDFVKPKLKVVPNGLTLGVEEPVAEMKPLPKGGRLQLLYLSSLMPSKGFFDVLQAVQLLDTQQPGRYHLNLCGSFVSAKTETAVEVHDEATLHAYIKGNGLEECVTYHGQVVGKQKEKQFTQANIFLLPTSYPWEGQPLSIIEALAFSIPVISCNHKGIPEMIECGRTGLFVRPKAPRSIASAIIDITEDSGRYSNMSLAAREHYEANFKRDVHLDQLTRAIYGKGH
jgi:glycosyltransferase involved in cell wall biosynthesis